ncbi:MAG TPA: glycosyltransferase [Pyrinomonadaceae bacterium]|nr:glycosyltransferase [Pyrinomonadaceae bacterium]
MPVFYFFATLLLLQSLLSLRGGFRYLSYFRRELARPPADYAPRATVVVPCRGLDQDLTENLSALFRQDYPEYEIVFAADSAEDPALEVAGELAARLTPERPAVKRVRAIVAGRAQGRGQKVHNLIAAVRAADPSSEVFVFVDTDARPRPDWLRSLVAPLADERMGAATGYRWFVPASGRLTSHLRSVWNASVASALGTDERRNFCWGGSTAIRRATFARLDMPGEWRGALSDDFAMTRAVRHAGLAVKFVPRCLTASHGDCAAAELFEFTTRQLRITRVYAPHLWRVVLVSNLLFTLVFFGGLALVAARAAAGLPFAAPLLPLAAIFVAGSLKAALRLRAVSPALVAGGEAPRARHWLAHLALWPLTSALFAWNALAAAASRRITWRGITYELKSPDETVIIARAPAAEIFWQK